MIHKDVKKQKKKKKEGMSEVGCPSSHGKGKCSVDLRENIIWITQVSYTRVQHAISPHNCICNVFMTSWINPIPLPMCSSNHQLSAPTPSKFSKPTMKNCSQYIEGDRGYKLLKTINISLDLKVI